MYKAEFDNLLKQDKTFKSYIFFGESSFLVDYYTKLVSKSFTPQVEDIQKLYFDEYNFKKAKDILLQSSLFCDSNTLVLKIEKPIPKKECLELIEAANTNSSSTLIVACFGDADFREMAKNFDTKTNGVNVRFFTPFASEAIKILQTRASELNLLIENPTVLHHLLNMHRNNIELAFNDLEKLSILDTSISTKIVDNHCFGFGNVNLDDFIVNLLQQKDISNDLTYLLDEGINEVFIINQITSFVWQLFMFNSFIKINGYINSSEILGYKLPKNIEDERAKLAIKFQNENYLNMFSYLFDVELKLKSSTNICNSSFLQTSLRNFSNSF